ncbi:P-loop containing nucleoside triphosphate hydrolase protein [Kickxella alabastrina]|uniref:P-loop containing nucleoside triphosphate hydrolase protein n=1 Tax=Kickxella alabastrina TaxID=61397 RepID=UPI002220DDF5|nr:P-loop containing nucleoside triphosphate hydrolase protein [Kickxella alabastrina]KAI7826267.1 P-loop containing nucleoside triphosphate hydrolase protein [Kickxella alabastrina]
MSGSVVYASQISNKKLCKPFIISTANALKRPIARPLGTTSKRLRIRSNNDDDDDDDAEKREDAILLPGVNYNGMSKSVFKPFRPPTKIRKDGDEEDADEAIADQSSADGKLAFRPLGMRRRLNIIRGPRYNPDTDDAVVLFRPEDVLSPVPPSPSSTSSGTAQAVVPVASKKRTLKEILGCGGSSGPEEGKLVAVVVDPVLGRKLRPHQVDGVKFLYNCITGSIYPNAFGCIMADEMGLGKTLQCIALLWTLLQQSPIAGKPIIEKCIVACPSSLWLGSTKISPLACDNKGTKDKVTASLRAFMSARGRRVIHPVLIISYESLRIYKDILSASPIGLLMCDEGHRLKNSDSQTFQALNELQIQRRIILSGTPIQNDLSEYFSLLNFTNPGLLGDTQEFRKKYEIPIMHGRDSMATEAEQRRGDEVLSQLNAIASRVIIRRTNNLLSKYLPIKYEHVVFCPLTELQTDLYELFLKSKDAKAAIGEGGKCSLQTIISLGKLCNHPSLLDIRASVDGYEKRRAPVSYAASDSRSAGDRPFHPKWSSKMAMLDRMLQQIHKGKEKDKIVLISNYTQTLDLFEGLCQARNFGHYRLDGTMTISKRQTIVDRFNDPSDPAFVFLLSSKAGGCGINLVGANRLVLFDSSFNPAENLQACGRIWRDGQKKPCYIYTFVTTGTVEEKIFQRQSYKTSLSTCVIDEQENVERHFSRQEMKQLFQAKLRGTTACETHDQFKCRRCVKGHQAIKATEPMDFADHNSWDHFSFNDCHKLQDQLLKSCMGKDVSFVFQYKSH